MYTALVRVHVSPPLGVPGTSWCFRVGGRAVELKADGSEGPDVPISESNSLHLTAHGFDTEQAAEAFGKRLNECCGLAGTFHKIGISIGSADRSTPGIFVGGQKTLAGPGGRLLRGFVHGVDVFQTAAQFDFFRNWSNAMVPRPPYEPFFDEIGRLFDSPEPRGAMQSTEHKPHAVYTADGCGLV